MKIVVGKTGQGVDHQLLDSMFRVRRTQFADRLGWEVTVDGQGREVDWYDALGPVYVLAQNEETSECMGCMRLLPTTGPYMLRDIFGEMLNCTDVPVSRTTWEISRLAVVADQSEQKTWGFGPTPAALIRAMLSEACQRGISAMVGVTTTSIARLMRSFGLEVEMLSKPMLIGTAKTIAFRLPVTPAVLSRVGVQIQLRAA